MFDSPDKLSSTIVNALKNEFGKERFIKLTIKNYGTYAATSDAEFFAEAFTNMKLLDDKNKTDFMKSFEKKFIEKMKEGKVKK